MCITKSYIYIYYFTSKYLLYVFIIYIIYNFEIHAYYDHSGKFETLKPCRLRWLGHLARIGENRTALRVMDVRERDKDNTKQLVLV